MAKTARLEVKRAATGSAGWFLRLLGANGEPLDRSEMYPTKGNANRAKEDRYPAYADVLRLAGWVCLPPKECESCRETFHDPSRFEDAEICDRCADELEVWSDGPAPGGK